MKTYNTSIFTNNNANSYYLLGLFITDGNIYDGESSISSIDLELLERIEKLISPDKLISKKNNSNCYRLRINNKIIKNWLMDNGCVPNKTKIVKFPNVPEKYLPDFIRGLIDGDGSIGLYNQCSTIRFDSASYDLINKFSIILTDYQIENKIKLTRWFTAILNGRKIQSRTQMYRITLTGLKAYKLLKLIYGSNPELYMKRKKDIVEKIFAYIERNGFLEEELLSMERLPMHRWGSDEDLINCCIKHKGVLKLVAEEYNVASWTISFRLRKIDKYNYIRSLFPFNRIDNINRKNVSG